MTPETKPSHRRGLYAALLLAGLCVPIAASANSALRGIMHTWKRDLRTSDAMLSGHAPLNEATLRGILTSYAQDAGRIAGQIRGQSSDSRDIRHRFQVLQAEAQGALQHTGQPAVLRSDFRRIVSTCQSCHDAYN